MKHILLLVSLFMQLAATQAQKAPASDPKLRAPGPLHGNGLCFTPNKGQIVDSKGSLRPDVLYKGGGGGADIYLRKSGISYVYNNAGLIMEQVAETIDRLEKQGKLNAVDPESVRQMKEKLLRNEKMKVHRVDMDFVNANPNVVTSEEEEVGGFQNFYYAHCPKGITNVRQYNKVTCQNIYNNIDVTYYGNKQNGLKYDIIVKPHADPRQIKLSWNGAERITMVDGKLRIETSVNEFYESIPKVYQNINGTIVDVKTDYTLSQTPEGNTVVGFSFASYNPEFSLVIDPWVTYYGQAFEAYAEGICGDRFGNVYVACGAVSATFPTLPGGYTQAYAGSYDGFIIKFDAAGTRLWAMFFGGTNDDTPNAIAVDQAGSVMITGYTKSADLPIQTAAGGYSQAFSTTGSVAYVAEFNTGGALLWSTYYGGSKNDVGNGIATDKSGNVFISGFTSSADFPVQTLAGGYSQSYTATTGSNMFVVGFSSTGARLWATLYGGTANDQAFSVATDPSGNIFVGGWTQSADFPILTLAGGYSQAFATSDATIIKFSPTGVLLWSTIFGSPSGNSSAYGGITSDASGNIIIGGTTSGAGLPLLNAYQGAFGGGGFLGGDAMVAKFDGNGKWIFSTYFGGIAPDRSIGIVTDASNNIFLCMEAEDAATADVDQCSYNPQFNGGSPVSLYGGDGPEDQLIVKFSPLGDKICSTYMGGTGEDDLDICHGGLGITGNQLLFTGASNGGYPVTPGAFQTSYSQPAMYPFGTVVSSICTNICESKTIGMSFVANKTNVCTNTPLSFTPTVTNTCDTTGYKYLWTFTGGTPSTSTSPLPTVTYSSPGSFDVKMVVTTLCKKDSFTSAAYIKVDPCAFTLAAPGATICTGSCYTIPANASGGTAPYTYSWSNGATSPTISVCPLSTNSYSVLVTDANGQQASTGSTIIVSNMSMNPTSVDNSCSTSGSAAVAVTNGVAPYTYAWSGGQTGSSIYCPVAGTYSVTVADALGCTATQAFTVNGAPTYDASFTQSPNTTICIGSTVNFTSTGTRDPNLQAWAISKKAPIVTGSTVDFSYTFLTAGSYSVTHTVSDGICTNVATSTVNVINCSAPTITAIGNTICSGTCASVTSTPSGGTSPYTYLWSNGATTQNINPCPASTATYTVTITDAGAFTATTTVTVTVNPVVNVTATPTNVSCFGGSTGSVLANGSSGTSPYSYSWSGTQTTQTISNLAIGNYTVTITDSKGCTSTSTTAITQPAVIALTASQNTPSTCSGNNGVAVTTAATGGTGTFSYLWSNGSTGLTASPLASGTYTVTATDANGCTKTSTAIINNNPLPTINSVTPSALLCNGATTGSAVVSATGTGTLTYSWTNGNTGATSTNLGAGTYYVTVSDATGCNAISSVVITNPVAITVNPVTPVNANCGASNGSAVASASGGTGALTYTWSNLASGQTANGLSAATYTVTVKDANACSVTNTISIGNNNGPSVQTTTPVNELCHGNSSGSASVTITGGNSPYTYSWSNGTSSITNSLNNSITSLPANTYIVTITDNNSCTTTTTIIITEPTAVSTLVVVPTNASCGAVNGSAVASASGGTGTLTYYWSSLATGATATNLSAATYTVTVSDANSCTATNTVAVGNNNGPSVQTSAPVNELCNGSSTGSASVTISGGSSPYTYSWSNSISSVTNSLSNAITSLPANTYIVTITDNNSCTATTSIIVTEPTAISNPVVVPTNASCGAGNGSAVASASGGTGALTYTWSNLASGQTATGLSAATYTVTVKDANACSITNTVAIGSNNGPSVQTTTPVNELCNGSSTGSASVTITGGSSPYTYSWSNSISSITSSLNNSITSLQANTYIVTITDNNNCSATTSVNITEPTAISVPTIIPTNATCGNSDGSAIASTSGGTGALTYSWSNLASGQTATSLSAAIYTVTVTDANSCSITNAVTINNASGPVINSVIPNNPLCSGGTGTAVANASGGTGALTYTWSNLVSGSTASGLSAGTYSVTVKDASGCLNTSTVVISVPPAITIPSTSSSNSTCGNANGSANAVSSGGTGTLTYSWSNGATGQTATNLSVQTYTISVTDANACVVTKAVTIGNDNAPLAALSVNTAILCNGGTGSITATATGGNPNYTYSWSSSVSSVTNSLQSTINNLTSATYTVTITDVSGCSHSATILLPEPSAVSITNITPVNSNCGTATGSAIATASGGTGTLTYSWSNLATGQTNTGLAANTYTLTVTDANACNVSQTITINNNGGPTITSITSVNELCHAANTGSASVVISGGASPYTYVWAAGATQVTTNTQSTINNQLAGNYIVTITDANGCQQTSNVSITEPPAVSITSVNPVNASCGTNNGSAVANASGGTGTLTYSWSNAVSGQTNTALAANTYTLSVTDASGCAVIQSVPISNTPAPAIVSITPTPVVCNGGSNGSVVIAATGTGTLTYSWSAGSTSVTQSNLSAGIYTVTVSDASGCQQISAVTIVQPVAITITAVNTTSAGCNKNDGTATASANGGTPLLTYSWSNLATGPAATGLPAGSYTLTVTDAKGCAVTNAVTINSISGPTASTSIASAIKCSGQTGNITATASSGTVPYTYNWSAGVSGSGSQVSGLAGTYTVTVADANACTSVSTVTLTEPPAMIVTPAKTDATCGNANGFISTTVTGGTSNYTYSWSDDSTKSSISNLKSGTYVLTLTDANGCVAITSSTIATSTGPIPGITSSKTTITEGNSTVLIGSSTGGGITYTWTPASSLSCSDCVTPTANPGATTTYTLYVKDDQGCVDSANITITVKKACSGTDGDIYIANIFSPNGDGKNDVLNIEGNAITNIYWAIYDRWGNLLFETTDQAQGWDGTKNGSPMESATYVYYLKAICTKTNTEVKLKGNVSIVK